MITFVFLLSLFVAIFFETGGLERCSSPEQDILEHVLPPPSPSSDPCTFRLSEFVHLTLLTHLARLTNCRTWVTEKVFWEVCHHRTPPLQILQTVNQKCGKMWNSGWDPRRLFCGEGVPSCSCSSGCLGFVFVCSLPPRGWTRLIHRRWSHAHICDCCDAVQGVQHFVASKRRRRGMSVFQDILSGNKNTATVKQTQTRY